MRYFIFLITFLFLPFQVGAKNYYFDFFTKLNLNQTLSEEVKSIHGEINYAEIKYSYNFANKTRGDVDVEFWSNPLSVIPVPNVTSAYLNYIHRKGLSFQVGFKEIPLGYYRENIKTFAFNNRDFSFNSLFANQNEYLASSSNFGGFVNWKVNRDFRLLGGLGVLKNAQNFKENNFEVSKDALKNLSAFATARYIVRQNKAYKGTVFATFSKQQGEDISSQIYEDRLKLLTVSKNLVGFGGRTGLRIGNYYTRIRGEVWGSMRDYLVTPYVRPDQLTKNVKDSFIEEAVSKAQKRRIGWKVGWPPFEIEEEEVTPKKEEVVAVAPTVEKPKPQNHSETIWSFYVYPEVQVNKKWKAGLFVAGAKSDKVEQTTSLEGKLRVSYKVNKKITLSGEYFYANPHSSVNGLEVFDEPPEAEPAKEATAEVAEGTTPPAQAQPVATPEVVTEEVAPNVYGWAVNLAFDF